MDTPTDDKQRREERDVVPARPLHSDATDPTDPDPHHVLSNPADEPDPTEYPDPYDRREDPRDPAAVDTPAFPADRAAARERPGGPPAPSTSEPPPPRNYDEVKPEKGD